MTGAADPVGLLGGVPGEGVMVAGTRVAGHHPTVAAVILGGEGDMLNNSLLN